MENSAEQQLLCLKGGSSEVVEKRSRFLGKTAPVSTEEEALAFIDSVRRANRDARHNCSAYIVGEERIEKCSDDGEPAKTAGMPMLDLLKKKNLGGVCVVVTRYFGGILLGTGGLVRAYGLAAAKALENSSFAPERRGFLTEWAADYASYGKIRYLAESQGIPILDVAYGAEVILKILLPEDKAERFQSALREMSGGKIAPRKSGKVRYLESEGTVRIL